MKKIAKYLFVSVKQEHLEMFQRESLEKEFFVIKIASKLLIIFECFMLGGSFFKYGKNALDSPQLYYTLMYLIMLSGMILFLYAFSRMIKNSIVSYKSCMVIKLILINFLLLWNIGITFLDQNVYPGVTTYITTIFALAVLNFSETKLVIGSYIFMQGIYMLFLHYFQPSDQVRYGDYINTFITILFATLTVMFINRNRVLEFENRMTIKEKNRELKELSQELIAANERLREQAYTDQLTGISNRYFFEKSIGEAFRWADQRHSCISLAIADLDHFKKINDEWGHPVGDKVLIRVAEIAKAVLHDTDKLARLGGEEFIILMPDTDLEEARLLVEKMRITLAKEVHDSAGTVTASFGVAERKAGEHYDSLYRRADEALYMAKEAGRNCVICHNIEDGKSFVSIEFVWMEEWESGSKVIDDQHRNLIGLANQLIHDLFNKWDKDTVSADLKSLLEHLICHFNDEERVMEEAGYPELEMHRQIHKELIEKTKRLADSLEEGMVKSSKVVFFIMDDVLIGHIMQEDTKAFPSIRMLNNIDKGDDHKEGAAGTHGESINNQMGQGF